MKRTGYFYLAQPIDQIEHRNQRQADAWRARIGQVKRWIHEQGWGTYDPAEAFQVGHEQQPDRSLAVVNNMALGRSVGMVAFLPPGVASIGVPIEIERAANSRIPVLIIGGHGSWMLAKYENMQWVRQAQEVEKVEDCLDWLAGMALANQINDKEGTRWTPLGFKQVRPGESEDLLEYGTGKKVGVLGELDAVLPSQHYAGDVGYDLTVTRNVTVPTFGMVDVPCNIAVELPEWAWGLIIGRSSAMRNKGLQVHPGVIDSGYRGELFASVSSVSGRTVLVEAGERLAQLIVMSNHAPTLRPVMVAELSPSERGSNGFGSTGA